MLAFTLFQVVRGVRAGKREQKRLEALFVRVTQSACPFCGNPFGDAVRKSIQLSLNEEYQLPTGLTKLKHLCTWRITCPQCKGSVLLAEDEGVFELLKGTVAEPRPLRPSYVALVVVLSLAVLAAAIYSMVRFFIK
jgi:hypothetical protein